MCLLCGRGKLNGSAAQILTAVGPNFSKGLAEPLAPIVASCQAEGGYTHIVAAANTFGKNLLPRVAALLDVQPIAVRRPAPAPPPPSSCQRG